jgi:hypothetical protein
MDTSLAEFISNEPQRENMGSGKNNPFGTYDPPKDAVRKIVFAFDRDKTVSVNPPRENKPAVPLDWITHLAHDREHVVFAIGNQVLKQEAKIPGTAESIEKTTQQEMMSLREENDSLYGHPLSRVERVALLHKIYPDAERYIVVDDRELSELESEGWEYYKPWDFVEKIESDKLLTKVDFSQRDPDVEN